MVYTADRPFRQDDPRWAREVMWDRDAVIEVHTRFNEASKSCAESLLRSFKGTGGNTIGNEGCLISCLAMVLAHLCEETWNPSLLNAEAIKRLYYSRCGLAMATLYSDLISEVSAGEVQLCLKEEYLSGEQGWSKVLAHESLPLRAYRSLPRKDRKYFIAMLKTGTYDDTVASHYVIADPLAQADVDDPDVPLLDPAMPMDWTGGIWTLSRSAQRITEDKQIRKEWDRQGIDPLQIAGVWLFARWQSKNQRSLIMPLAEVLAR